MDRERRVGESLLAFPRPRGLLAWAALVLLLGGCYGPLLEVGPGRPLERLDSGALALLDEPDAAANEPRADGPESAAGGRPRRGPVWPASAELAPSEVAEEVLAPRGEALDAPADSSFTVESAMQYALAHHPLLQARSREVEIARAKLVGAGLLPNPNFVMDVEGAVQHDDPTQMTARLMFTVPTAGKIGRRIALAREGIKRAESAVSRQTEAVLLEASDAAVEVLYLQELVSLYARFSELAAKVAQTQRDRFDAAASTLADKIEAEVDATEVELRRLEAASRLEAARQRLARSIALAAPAVPRMDGKLPFEPLPAVRAETLLAVARATRPELAEAKAALGVSQEAQALAQAEAHPDLQWGPRYQDRLGEDRDAMGARIDLDIPVFDRNQGNICETAAQVRANRALLAAAELATLSDVAAAHAELATVEGSLRYHKTQAMPLADRTEEALRDNLDTPVIDPNQASNILRDLIRMRVQELELRHRYVQLRTRLEVFLGRQLTDLEDEQAPLPHQEAPLPHKAPSPHEPTSAREARPPHEAAREGATGRLPASAVGGPTEATPVDERPLTPGEPKTRQRAATEPTKDRQPQLRQPEFRLEEAPLPAGEAESSGTEPKGAPRADTPRTSEPKAAGREPGAPEAGSAPRLPR